MLPRGVRNHLKVRLHERACKNLKNSDINIVQTEIAEEEDNLNDMDIKPESLQERFENFNMYEDFVLYYVSAVVGLRHFEKQKLRSNYSEYATVSDEAFAVLTIENNWNRWMSMAKTNHWKDSPVRTKWTVTRDTPVVSDSGKLKKQKLPPNEERIDTDLPEGPQARRYRGWSAQGINRYNQLFDQIKKERNSKRGKRFEVKLRASMEHRAANEKNNGKNKKRKTELTALPMPKHELWSSDITVGTTTATIGSDDESDATEEEIGPSEEV